MSEDVIPYGSGAGPMALPEDQAARSADPRVRIEVARLDLARAALHASVALRRVSILSLPPWARSAVSELIRAAERYAEVLVHLPGDERAAAVGKDAAAGGDR
jgi:hypothetical protein